MFILMGTHSNFRHHLKIVVGSISAMAGDSVQLGHSSSLLGLKMIRSSLISNFLRNNHEGLSTNGDGQMQFYEEIFIIPEIDNYKSSTVIISVKPASEDNHQGFISPKDFLELCEIIFNLPQMQFPLWPSHKTVIINDKPTCDFTIVKPSQTILNPHKRQNMVA